jgi:hypothetical protein
LRTVDVDPAGAGAPEQGGCRQVVEEAGVGYEGCVHTVQRGTESVGDAPQPGDDRGEALQDASETERFGVVHGRLEAQDVFALGVRLDLQQAEQHLEVGQAVPGFLDHDLLGRGPTGTVRVGAVLGA